MIPVKSAKELKRLLKKTNSGCAGDTILSVKAVVYIAELLEQFVRFSPKRKPTKWNRFFAKGVKEGLSVKQISRFWQRHKFNKKEKP